MLDFLTTAIPDIWMPEAILSLDSLGSSMMRNESGLNGHPVAIATPGNTVSTSLDEGYQHVQQAQSMDVEHPEAYSRDETENNQDKYNLDVPSAVVDDL
jgi:hypothetical protein